MRDGSRGQTFIGAHAAEQFPQLTDGLPLSVTFARELVQRLDSRDGQLSIGIAFAFQSDDLVLEVSVTEQLK
jgi:hypothetical protein